MGGKTCKPVVEASAARDALVACGELMNARHDYSRFAATCNAKGKVTKEAFMSECLVPKFGAHFTQQLLDRIFINVSVSAASGPVEEDDYMVFHYLCYKAPHDHRIKFVFNLADYSASERVYTKDFEKFLLEIMTTPDPVLAGAEVSRLSTIEEKDSTLKALLSALSESVQAQRAGSRDPGSMNLFEFRSVMEEDPRVLLFLRCMQTHHSLATQRAAQLRKQAADQETAGVTVPLTHTMGFFDDVAARILPAKT